jgi:hypothetical protein
MVYLVMVTRAKQRRTVTVRYTVDTKGGLLRLGLQQARRLYPFTARKMMHVSVQLLYGDALDAQRT